MSRIVGNQLEFLEAQEVEHRKLLETRSFAKFWLLVYENWFKCYPEHAVLFPNIPMDQLLTQEQEDELGEAVQKRQTVSIHILEPIESLLMSGYSENSGALDDLPAVLTNLFETLLKKTHWKFSCVMAGPDPRRDWDITTMSFHLGQTPMGCDFATWWTDVKKTLMSAYAEFAELVFHEYAEDKRRPGVNTTKEANNNDTKEEADNNDTRNVPTQALSESSHNDGAADSQSDLPASSTQPAPSNAQSVEEGS
ncbi:hypothetical protein L210DRAFT_3651686 [Boletus edulis BED1]|uniref:Uncharacterized protein n=1 Tax=Boletus edulis BED1 TaxID=1328754 RepID=A0AAD4BHY4_BOLED|nr:hypothetical protein L210DRAFT_3651686 [Boletus edulis BED1]